MRQADKRVIVCDDDRDSRALLGRIVRSCGFTVLETATGEHAFEALLTGGFHCAFLDIGLPGIDGLEVARLTRAARPRIRPRLVAVTGRSSSGDLARSREAGFDLHLVKPIAIDQILAVLSTLRVGPPRDTRSMLS